MQRTLACNCVVALFIILIAAVSAGRAAEPPLHTLYRFQGGADGENPIGNLVADAAGNLYGTTEYGGAGGYYGTVFELIQGNPLVKTTLYSFTNRGDGARPAAGLILDNSGNLYGTASDSNAGGYGEVFSLSPPAAPGGAWTETVIYRFTNGDDGAAPYGGLVSDQAGNLYGTTESSVFELSPPGSANNSWSLIVLHDFHSLTLDGWSSQAGLVRDTQGNLYGTTEWGGSTAGELCPYSGCGVVFEVMPPAAASQPWRERVLHRFGVGADGSFPVAGLALDAAGNLYGTTYSGGAQGGGVAFELSRPQGEGRWMETILHNFSYTADDGAAPAATLTLDTARNLFGTTLFGGNSCYYNNAAYGCGVVFELSPPVAANAPWNEAVLYKFLVGGTSPKQPEGGLMLDSTGDLFGTSAEGGYQSCNGDYTEGCGTIYEIVR